MENPTAEVIQQQMQDTRNALTEKLEALQSQVADTVKDATASVTEGVESVKDAVTHTVETVAETVQDTVSSVKDVFNMHQHMENHPWVMMGGAVVLGYIGGSLLPSHSDDEPAAWHNGAGHHAYSAPEAYDAPAAPRAYAAPRGGMMSELLSKLEPWTNQLKGLAIGATTRMFGDLLHSAVPAAYQEPVQKLVDQFTEAVGGKVMHSDTSAHSSGEHASAAG